MRTGIFGGSFDPPHRGHLFLVTELAGQLSLDRVIVIPAGTPPHKSERKLAPDHARIEMCGILFSDKLFTVSDMEIKRTGKSYTVDTVRQLKNMYPDDEFFLFMGADMLLYFDKWFKWREISDMCTVCAAARDKKHPYAELRKYADETLVGAKVVICPVKPIEVSSTEIRHAASNMASLSEYMPAELEEYIYRNGLYREK